MAMSVLCVTRLLRYFYGMQGPFYLDPIERFVGGVSLLVRVTPSSDDRNPVPVKEPRDDSPAY